MQLYKSNINLIIQSIFKLCQKSFLRTFKDPQKPCMDTYSVQWVFIAVVGRKTKTSAWVNTFLLSAK